MKKSILFCVLLLIGTLAEAQIQTPAASAPASVSTQVGLTDIKVDYFRPRAKGRKIFGTEAAVREAGAMRSEGKEYIVADGDVLLFRFNV